jgi:replicative DNA helicase
MMTKKGFNASNKKRFDDFLPKLDNGNTDWETVKNRVAQNIDATEMLLGKLPPQAIQIEEAVLGACLMDIEGFTKAKDVLHGFSQPFYTDAHNAIWEAMEHLTQKKETIDRLTVYLELERMQKTKLIDENASFLLRLTEQVASASHVESHSRIILEKHLRRKLMHQAVKLFQQASDSTTELFDVIDNHKLLIDKLTDFNPILKSYTFPAVMEMAKKATKKAFLVGSLIKAEDVCILFSGPENGKSILGVQMADKISKGESLFDGLLPNECGAQKVLYFDFELTLGDYKERYLDDAGNEYLFKDDGSIMRIGNDEQNPKTFAEIANNMERILIRNIELEMPKVVFIDNITAMSNGSTADAEVVRHIMDLLMQLKKKHKLTVIVLAHTPKRYDLSRPLVLEDLAGSSLLAAYADSVIVIGKSKMGNNVKYLKHLKVRSGKKIHDEQNVIQVVIEKIGNFLQFIPLEEPTGYESEHLIHKYDASIDDELIQNIVLLYDAGKSYQMIKDELNLKMSRQHIGRIIKNYKEKNKK